MKKMYGFTVVELVVVIVIIGILATISALQFSGVMQNSRDTERKTDINAIASQIEQYYSRNGGYPSRENLNNSSFRSGNRLSSGGNNSWFVDPSNKSNTTLSSTSSPTNTYSYIPQPDGCASPTDGSGSQSGTINPCKTYTLIARLEVLDDDDKDSVLSNSTASYYAKRNANN